MLIENVILGRRGFLPLAALTGFGLYGCSKSGTITTPTTSAADVEMFNQLIVAATTFDYKTFFTLLEEYSKSPERSKDYKQVLEHAVKIADDKKANEQFLVHDTYMKNKIMLTKVIQFISFVLQLFSRLEEPALLFHTLL